MKLLFELTVGSEVPWCGSTESAMQHTTLLALARYCGAVQCFNQWLARGCLIDVVLKRVVC
jgi:hypothetical protein